MGKIYKKEELQYINGYIVKGDEIVAIDDSIVALLNKLDEDVQRKRFDDAKKGLIDLSAFDAVEFERESERPQIKPTIHVDTPVLDQKVEEGKAFAKELDLLERAGKVEKYFDHLATATKFVIEDCVVESSFSHNWQFDLPVLGNPLELTRDELAEFVFELFDVESE